MENNDLTKALMKRYDVQEFMGGGEATHTMPDGTVMPGATHAEYEAMGYQEGGVPMMPMAMPEEQMQPMDPAMELESAIEGLQIQKMQANDPDEIKALDLSLIHISEPTRPY